MMIDESRIAAVKAAVAEALGEAYDCTRVWSAWGHGTMSSNDFELVAESDERINAIGRAAIEAFLKGTGGPEQALKVVNLATFVNLLEDTVRLAVDAFHSGVNFSTETMRDAAKDLTGDRAEVLVEVARVINEVVTENSAVIKVMQKTVGDTLSAKLKEKGLW